MKTPLSLQLKSDKGKRAFTLPELLITMAIMFLVLGGLITCHLFGLRMFELTKSKLGASDEARAAFNFMAEEIRSAKLIRLGSGSLTEFEAVGIDTPQCGNAIEIYPTTNFTSFIRYYWDATDRKLKRTTNGSSYALVVANAISNNLVFTSEDYAGNVLTNNENNRLIAMTLQFYQLQYPPMSIGPGCYYDFYQLRSKITRRTLE